MAWVFLEIVAALAIAAGIVWWTWPRQPRDNGGNGKPARSDEPPKG